MNAVPAANQAEADYLSGVITYDEYQEIFQSSRVAFLSVLGVVGLLGFAQVITCLGLYWRRLHDAGFSGLFYLLSFVGLSIVPLIMCIMPSNPSGVKYDSEADQQRP